MEMSEANSLLAERSYVTVVKAKDGGEDFTASYCWALATPENLDELDNVLRAMTKEDADYTEQVSAFVNVVLALKVEWNLKVGGEPVALTVDSLRKTVSGAILSAVVLSILTHTRPDEPAPPTSPSD